MNINPSVSVCLFVFLCFSLPYLNDLRLSLFLQAPTLLYCLCPPTARVSISLCLCFCPLFLSCLSLSAFLSIISLTPSFYSQAPWGDGGGQQDQEGTSFQHAENGPIKATRLLRLPNKEEAKIAPGGSSWKDKQRKREKGQNECRVRKSRSFLARPRGRRCLLPTQTRGRGLDSGCRWTSLPHPLAQQEPSSHLEAALELPDLPGPPPKCSGPTSHLLEVVAAAPLAWGDAGSWEGGGGGPSKAFSLLPFHPQETRACSTRGTAELGLEW